MDQPDLSIIVVSHNTRDYTLAALKAIHNTIKTHTYEVIVVENASQDQSYEAIQQTFPKDILVKSEKLIGFSEANALGVQQAHGEFFFFLNPDTQVQDGAIDLLIEHLRSLPACGAITGQLLNPNGTIQPQGGSLPNLFNVAAWMFFIDDLPFLSTLFVPYQQRNIEFFKRFQEHLGWIGGTALLISKSLYEKIGGWDSAITLYGEDVELCKRVHSAGKQICLYPGSKIIHHQNKSTGSSHRARIGEMEGLIYYWKKHYPPFQVPILKAILWMGSWLRIVLFGILMRDESAKHTYFEAQKRVVMA